MSSSEMRRRQFLRDAAIVVGTTAVAANLRATPRADSPVKQLESDIERFRKVDPALIRYERETHFSLPKADARRLTIHDERLYVAAGNSILLLDSRGNSLGTIATSAPVRGIAVASDGTVFAGVKDHVELFDAQRKRIATWDAPPGKPLITGIAVGERDVFVADAGNRIVWRYDRSGKLARRIGEKDTARNIPGFVIPSPYFDVELGPDGLVRVANPGRHRVETYTADGDLETSWGKPGAGTASFCGCCNPCNIEVLPDGRVVTFEKGLPRVKVFSAHGELECVVAAPASFADPGKNPDNNLGGLDGTIDANGRVYVLDIIAGDVLVFAPKKSSAA
jgi:hypothetical protein